MTYFAAGGRIYGKGKADMSNSVMIKDFTKGSVAKQLILFATPLFMSNLLQIVYNMVDMIVVGNVIGQAGLSAVSVGGDISNTLTFFAMGFSNAGQVIISQYIGADRREKVGCFIGTMVTFLLSVSVTLTAVGLIFRNGLLNIMNTPAAARADALAYSVTCMIGLVFIYGYNIVSAILRGMGDSKHPFMFIGLAAVMNIILDIVFVYGMGMRAFGAALATVISQTFSFICSLIFLYRSRKNLGFEIKASDFRINGGMLSTLLRLGIPMAIKQSAVQFSKLFVNSWINSYGVSVSAVAGIGNKLNSISNLFSNCMNTAGSSMVGQNIGAKKFDRVPKIMLTAFSVTFTTSLILTAAILLFPEQIFMLFTDNRDIIPVAMRYVPVAVLVFFGSAFRSLMNALMNGSGNFAVNFAVALLDGIILRIGLAVAMGLWFNMGYVGFWYGDALAGFTPFVIGIVYYFSGRWKTRRHVIRDEKK